MKTIKMKKNSFFFLVLLAMTSFISCNTQEKKLPEEAVKTDPLLSWNETATKKAIIDFVTAVTTEGSAQFIPEEERIATFDNDGTLWCEQPLYFEVAYSLSAMKDVFAAKPELLKKPELKALADKDMKTFMASGEKGIAEVFALSHTVVGVDDFNKSVQAWLQTKHEKFGKPYGDLTYKPMVELLKYLRDNHFKTYIVSGGSSMFMRNFTEKAYGIPPEQVIGTMLKAEFKPDTYQVVFTPELFHNDDHGGKPIGIAQFIGRKPVLAFGNSDGDLEMLQYTATNTRPNLCLLLHHTDAEREYAYDRESHIGQLNKALDEAIAKGWIVTDMAKDWKIVF